MSDQNSNSEEVTLDLKGDNYGKIEIDRLAHDRRVLVEVFNTPNEGSAMVDLSADDAIKAGEALIKAGRLARETE